MAIHRIRYSDDELLKKYRHSKVRYKEDWAHIDEMIRSTVADCSTDDYVSVHKRVVLVDSIYRSQLNRSVGRFAHSRVAREIASDSAVPAAILQVGRYSALTYQALPAILSAHSAIMTASSKAIPLGSHAASLRSFASKYLHFHATIVPIYDSRAARTISRFAGSNARSDVDNLNDSLASIDSADISYTSFCCRMVAVVERLRMLGQVPEVKEVDHMLWTE